MKKLLLIFCTLIFSINFSFSQSPQLINYQAVVRDTSGNLLINQNIKLKISIIGGNINANIVYSETHDVSCNSNGLVIILIGNGTKVLGDFMDISWGSSPHFMKTEIDASGGTNFIVMGTTQLVSVPYALHAGSLSLSDANGKVYDVSVDTNGNILSTPRNPIPGSWTCGDNLLDSRDGKEYTTTLIGSQCWMAQNLDHGTVITSLFSPNNNSIIERYCYNDSISNCDIYGGFYTWDEMMGYTTSPGVQGICPDGWHLPTDEEWCELASTVENAPISCSVSGWRGTAGGLHLRQTGTTNWLPPNSGATNSSGFTGLGSGYFKDYYNFTSKLEYTAFWTSSEYNWQHGYFHSLGYNEEGVYRGYGKKIHAYSVRCLKDSTSQACTPQPTQSNAGQDALNIPGTSTVLQANTPTEGSGIWSIVSGSGGSFSDTGDPGATFTGISGNSYVLEWTITNSCGSSSDNVNIGFGQSQFQCGDTYNDIRDGQSYNTVLIDTQCWMAQNLNYGTMIASNSNPSNNGLAEKYCYNDSLANCNIYGGLYQWEEMMQYVSVSGAQGICPPDWHIATDDEWCTLENEVDAGSITCSSTNWRGTDAGGELKESGTAHWLSPNTGGNNSVGFTALPGGSWSYISSSFVEKESNGDFWTSDDYSPDYAWVRAFSHSRMTVYRNDVRKEYGLSVRCIKD